MLSAYAAVVAIVLGATFLQFANALFAILLPVRLALAEAGPVVVGLIGSSYGAGFLLGCVLGPAMIRKVGHIRTFAALAGACALTALAFAATSSPWLWMILRLCQGVVLAGLFVVVEGWLAAATPKESRGGVIAFYLVMIKAAVILAQTGYALGRPDDPLWIGLAIAGFVAALIPVTLTSRGEPAVVAGRTGFAFKELWATTPAAVVGVMGAGLINGAIPALLPVWGEDLGLGAAWAVVLLSAMQLGSLLVQWPLGRLSDRVDRRLVILACLAGVTVVSAFVAVAPPIGRTGGFLLFMVLGGAALSFYGICAAHAADHAKAQGGMTGLASSLLFTWAVGAAIGPVVAAPMMARLGPLGLFVFSALVTGVVGAFILYRMSRRGPVPVAARPGFVNLPATSPAIGRIDPRGN